jgi:hypothetical protein
VNQQRRRGKAQVVVAETAGLFFAVRKIGDETLDGVEQESLQKGKAFALGPIYVQKGTAQPRCTRRIVKAR